jgi:hypothetical protein
MISVIISSADPRMLTDISRNIEATIGVPFEILGYENGNGQRGICAVYNQGMREAQYDMLCFMHEDISIKTKDWGKIVLYLFQQNNDLGLVGVAGSYYKALTPSGWLSYGSDTEYSNLLQTFKNNDIQTYHHRINADNQQLATVASVDGLWFCTPKKVALEFGFDQDTFTGFHAYDVDFSLSVGTRYLVAVTFDILMQHFSEGNFDSKWLTEALKLRFKWHRSLPVNLRQLSLKRVIYLERTAFRHFVNLLVESGQPLSVAVKVLLQDNRFYKLSPRLFFKILADMFKTKFGISVRN